MEIYNNCNCKCHEDSKPRCPACRPFHNSGEKTYTHKNDKANPTLGESDEAV